MSSSRKKIVFNFACALLLIVLQCRYSTCNVEEVLPMSREERLLLRDEARDMFYHAYNAYMQNAYPADELMPLSCQGRYRGLTPNRGDIDDALGNFSLTLIDTLDSLVVLNDFEEFEDAVKLVIRDVNFDNDVVVSVFETNIRILGGLLSAHVLADLLQERDGIMPWYKGELLNLAKDIGYRLLPSFNTTTGIPYSRINLRYGIKSDKIEMLRETCTACAGSMILEMAALSRLTGEPIFEEKAHKAMDELWKMRHRSSDLMGSVLNVHSGDWVRRDSGVGAGIDSYYEYCLKAYILLGDNKYLNRFNRHYNAIMKYISQGPMLLDVHMHRPHMTVRNYMDALLAFWPGLQVLKGDIKHAVETHEMLYQVMQRHNFIPEAFTTDFDVHWGNHPLRPEFLESTYFLYSATSDPYYLEVGKTALKSLQKYARVPCGYAAVNDVRTGKKEDRMDSFVLAETLKYLYLLFSDKEDIPLNLDEFIFTTEGHLFPLTLSGQGRNASNDISDMEVEDIEFAMTCPNTFSLFPDAVRKPLKHMVGGTCPSRTRKPRIRASEFSARNIEQLNILKDMGINLIALNSGKVQLYHSPTAARSPQDAEEGLIFMQEMTELSKMQAQQRELTPHVVSFPLKDESTGWKSEIITVPVGPAQFGDDLKGKVIKSRAVKYSPFNGCSDLDEFQRPIMAKGIIAIIERGDCMFIDKVRRAQKFGAIAAVIIDNAPDNSETQGMFSMSGDGTEDVKIPAVFMFWHHAQRFLNALYMNPFMEVILRESSEERLLDKEESVFEKLKLSVQEFLNQHTSMNAAKVVEEGGFRAQIGPETVKISFENYRTPDTPIFKDKELVSHHWLKMRKNLLKSILESESREIYVPLTNLNIYHKTINGENLQGSTDQAKWLLTELAKEYYGNDDDSLIKPPASDEAQLPAKQHSINEDVDQELEEKLDDLSSLINTLNEDQELLRNLLDRLKKDSSSDDLIKSGSEEVHDKARGATKRAPNDEL